jgi:hypothetical protein
MTREQPDEILRYLRHTALPGVELLLAESSAMRLPFGFQLLEVPREDAA